MRLTSRETRSPLAVVVDGTVDVDHPTVREPVAADPSTIVVAHRRARTTCFTRFR